MLIYLVQNVRIQIKVDIEPSKSRKTIKKFNVNNLGAVFCDDHIRFDFSKLSVLFFLDNVTKLLKKKKP